MPEEIKKKYIIKNKILEAPKVLTLQLVCEDNSVPFYFPGQFINIYFPETNTPEGKSYSISSAPAEKTLNITVKAMGEFSNHLCSLNHGDTIDASLPYGFFYSESENSPLVMLSAGIGITPFRSMICDIVKKNPARKLILFSSNQTRESIIFKKELDSLQNLHKNLKIINFITREKNISEENIILGRMTAENIFENLKHQELFLTQNPEFLICGSISFVSDLWKDLKKMGIPEEAIYTEAFFSH